jgi:hypothetical protein
MWKNPKETLLELIRTTYPGLFEQLGDADLERVIYEESGWRGRELLSHMAAWNRVVALLWNIRTYQWKRLCCFGRILWMN